MFKQSFLQMFEVLYRASNEDFRKETKEKYKVTRAKLKEQGNDAMIAYIDQILAIIEKVEKGA